MIHFVKDAQLEAGSVQLRAICDADRENVFALLTNEEVAKTYMLPLFESEAQLQALFERLQQFSAEPDRFVYGIYLQNRFIGLINEVGRYDSEIELGYAVLPAYRNRGYATAALGAAIRALFAYGFAAVKAAAFEENAASMRVMEKCGMTDIHCSEYVEYRGQRRRCICYRIWKEGEICKIISS